MSHSAPATGDIPWDPPETPSAPPVAGDLPYRFVALKAHKSELEAQLRRVKDDLDPLEEQLLEEFSTEGVSGKRHAATGKLVSITRRVWARAEDKNAAADALEAAGLGDYVQRGFNTNSLSAYFREQLKTRQEQTGVPVTDLTVLLPEQLRDVIDLTEDQTLSVRA